MPMPAATLRQLEAALINADKAGDTEAARALAAELQRLTAPPAPVPAAPESAVPAKAGFSLPDIGVAAGQGVVGVGKSITDFFGADNAASQALDKTQETLQGMYTPARQKEMAYQQQLMAAAEKEGPLAEAKAAWQGVKAAPLQATAQALGSIMPNLLSLLIPGVGEARAGLAVRSAYNAALGIVEGAGAVKGSIYDTVKRDLEQSGMSPQEAAAAASQAQEYLGKNMAQIGLGGGLGYVAGKTGLESLLAPSAGKAARIPTSLLSEFLTEGAQGGQERMASNIALQNIGRDVPTMQGVTGAATQEGIMGLMGAGAVAPFMGGQPQTTPAVPPTTPGVAPTTPPVAQTTPEGVPAGVPEPTVRPAASPETVPTTEPTAEAKPPVVPKLAPEAAIAPTGSTLSLMDQHKALSTELDNVISILKQARADGDTATIKNIGPEFAKKAKQLEALRTAIDTQGGTTETEPLGEKHAAEVAGIDKKIKLIETKLDQAIDNGDGDAMTKLASKLEEIKASRDLTLATQQKRSELQRTQATPAGETIPMFDATPQPQEVVRDIEAGAGPLQPEKQKRMTSTMQPDLFGDRDAEEIARQRRMRRPKVEVGETTPLFSEAQTPVPAGKQKVRGVLKFKAKGVPAITTQATMGPVAPEKTPEGNMFDLFGDYNLFNTALTNRDPKVIDALHKAQAAADRKAARSINAPAKTAGDEVAELMSEHVGGITRQEKVGNTYRYVDKQGDEHTVAVSDKIAAEIAAQKRKLDSAVTDKNGVVKRSMTQVFHDAQTALEDQETKLKALVDAKAPAGRITAAENKVQKAKDALAKQNERIQPELEKLRQLTAGLFKTEQTFGKAAPKETTAETRKPVKEEDFVDEAEEIRKQERQQELLDIAKRSKAKKSKTTAEAMETSEKDLAKARAREEKPSDLATPAVEEKTRYARGVEVESLDLTKSQIADLESGNITNTLSEIANDPKAGELDRAVSKVLSDLLDNTRVELHDNLYDDEGKEVLGEAVSTLVKLSRNGGLSQEVLLHEATHAGVERVIQLGLKDINLLSPKQQAAFKELRALFNSAKNDPRITSINAKTSMSEFAAEVLSNSNLQKQLRNKPWRVSDALRGFYSAILNLLGVPNVDSMLGASIKAVEALMIPSSAQPKGATVETAVNRKLSQRDIAALHDGTNSMKQFSEQFSLLIKQPDRTPEDVERIAFDLLKDINKNTPTYIPQVSTKTLDYERDAMMPDGTLFDIDDTKHYATADVTQVLAGQLLNRKELQELEATAINNDRVTSIQDLIKYLMRSPEYTLAENALVVKAATKYSVSSDKEGRLKVSEITSENRHPVAIVGIDAANAMIVELRAGKSMKDAFRDGLQKIADKNAAKNKRKQGWEFFEQSDDYDAAVNLNAGAAGTTWCTGASMGHASAHIKGGDFYIYYDQGTPEVAVRMTGKKLINEVRGNTKDQGLTPAQIDIATGFIQSKKFEDGDKYIRAFTNKRILKDVYATDRLFTPKDLLAFDEYGFDDLERVARSITDFGPVYGHYAVPPSNRTLKDVENKLKKSVNAALKEGHVFVGLVDIDEKQVGVTTGDGKTTFMALDNLRSAHFMAFSNKKESIELPNLEYVHQLDLYNLKDVTLPKLKQINKIFSKREGNIITVVDGTVINKIAPGTLISSITINGRATIKEVETLNYEGRIDITAPESTVNEVNEPTWKSVTRSSQSDVLNNFKKIAVREGYVERPNVFASDYDITDDGNKVIVDLPKTLQEVYDRFKNLVLDEFADKDVTKRGELEEEIDGRTLYHPDGELQPNVYFSDMIQKMVEAVHAYKIGGIAKAFAINRRFEKVLKEFGNGELETPLRAAQNGTVNALVIAPDETTQPVTIEPEKPRYARRDDSVGVYEMAKNAMGFRAQNQPANIAASFVATKTSVKDTLVGNVLGLQGRVQFVDKDAALSEAFKKGMADNKISDLEAQQAEYYLRFGQNRSQYATQFLVSGPVKLVEKKHGDSIERIYESTPGSSMVAVADAIAASKIGNDTEKEAILTAFIAGQRAKVLGWETLNIANPAKAEADYNDVMAMLDARPSDKVMFENAAKIYQDYNAGLLDFAVQTGTMMPDEAARLKKIPYVPFYRVENGEVQLIVSGEKPVRIGNLRDEPELKQLVGDSTHIMPIFTSSVQNTFMLTNMALRNQTVKDSAFMLHKIGIASKLGEGAGPTGPDTVRFKVKGVDYHVVIDTDLYGIPADLIVKGMEGIKTTIPAIVKMMGIPANILRTFVTRNPAYAVKQAIRDPLTAWMTTGTDGVPIVNAFTELASMVAGRSETERKLMAAGAISSNVITGDEQDMARALRDITSGKPGWAKVMAKLDAFAMQGDAATRAVVYKDSLNKGMTEMQALLRTLESMNFGRRGLSPSVQLLSTIIPFFNAQIQGLDVLYRAFKGDMPYSEQLNIRKKLMARGMLMAICTLAYAAAMGDDDDYKRAKPEERLGSWFLPNPFSDEMMRIPVPFELGYLFKSLPEAVWNAASEDGRSEDITKGMGKLLAMSNPFSLPQSIKPLTEVYLGKSFFGGDIESKRELTTMVPTKRYRESSTEVAKMMGEITGDVGLTPIKIDYLIRGYTGPLGIAMLSMVNPILRSGEEKERPTTKTSQLPFVGGLFQPSEGRGPLDAAYTNMLDIQQVKGTYHDLLISGDREGAKDFLENNAAKIALGPVSGSIQQRLGELSVARRRIISSSMSQEQKDDALKNIDRLQQQVAHVFAGVIERTERQYDRP